MGHNGSTLRFCDSTFVQYLQGGCSTTFACKKAAQDTANIHNQIQIQSNNLSYKIHDFSSPRHVSSPHAPAFPLSNEYGERQQDCSANYTRNCSTNILSCARSIMSLKTLTPVPRCLYCLSPEKNSQPVTPF